MKKSFAFKIFAAFGSVVFVASLANAVCADISGTYYNKNGNLSITQTACNALKIENVKNFSYGQGNIGEGLKMFTFLQAISRPIDSYSIDVRPLNRACPADWDCTKQVIKWLPSKGDEINLFLGGYARHSNFITQTVITLKPGIDKDGNKVLSETVTNFDEYDFLN